MESTSKPISPQVVADHILWLRKAKDEVTTPMHVIKLVYIAHGWMLGLFNGNYNRNCNFLRV